VVVGYRTFAGASAEVTLSPAAVVNRDELIFHLGLPEAASWLALAPMRVSIGGSRVIVGLKIMH
jgi:hypothetical protein